MDNFLRVEADQLRMTPCCPEDWSSFKLNYRQRDTLYRIEVHPFWRDFPVSGWPLDEVACPTPALTWVDDHCEYEAIVRLQRRGA